MKHYIEYYRNFDIPGYCAGIRMQFAEIMDAMRKLDQIDDKHMKETEMEYLREMYAEILYGGAK